jgi:hypothetical protein
MKHMAFLAMCAVAAVLQVPRAAATEAARPLDAAFLTGAAAFGQPLPLTAFAAPADAGPAQAWRAGHLKFEVPLAAAHVRLLLDRWNFATPEQEYAAPPPFNFTLVQVGDHLVPLERGIVPGAGIWWDWIVGPGRVWSEPGDGGWSRASLPFALIEKNANCMHHGVLTFLYRGEREVSRVAYQISQETCYYFKFDAWGTAVAVREPGAGIDEAAIAASYRNEVARRLPVKPIEALAADYPGLDPAQFGSPQDVTPEHMTLYGVLIRGVHYAGGCMTRQGPYPYCDEMPLPSYSLAKSVLAGFSLMRLELLHPGARRALVQDHVPECRDAGGWDRVTFEHELDMASGRYDSTASEADENASSTSRFFIATTHAEKIAIACTRYPRKAAPGKRWVYHTTDTYILGAALAHWWRARHGAEADFYRDLLLAPVYRRLGLSPELATPRRTVDEAAQPFTGWGLVLRRDDVVKLGGFLAIGEGRLGTEPLLDTGMTRAALQRDRKDPGLRATDENFRYNNGLWAWNIQQYLGCRKPAWIPFMSGFGGISVVMLPSGIVYYYVSDNAEFRWARAVAEAHRIGPVCRQRGSHD